MKKLESIKDEKFVVSEDQLLQIKGGYGGPSYSATESDTSSDGHGDDCMPDRCVDW